MNRTLSFGLMFLVGLAAVAQAAPQQKRAGGARMLPQDGALVGLHELRREGHLTCMAEHTHSGSSTGQPSRKAAEVAAMRSWSDFTAWEYGSHWGSASQSASKRMSCTGGGTSWSCDFESRPCRR